jgi:hypothetical protein
MKTLLRLLHAWAWTALWLFILGKVTNVAPVGFGGALVLALLLTPAIYFPFAALNSADAENKFVVSLLVAPGVLGGLAFSLLALGFVGFMGSWDGATPSTSKVSLFFTVFLLHGLVMFFVKVVGNILIPNDEVE